MPFRSFAGSWRRMLAVVVLALAMIIAPQATELCGAACARTAASMAMPSMAMPAAEAGHCASHAASSHAVQPAHACGMPAHALPVQVDAATATVASARASLAQLPQPTPSAMFPALTAAFAAASEAPPPPARLTRLSARSRSLVLALRI